MKKDEGERGTPHSPSSFFSLFPAPALVDVITVFTLRAAKLGIGAAGDKNPVAVLAGFQGAVLVCQHEAEHHLKAQEQRVKIPYDCRPVQQGDAVGGAMPPNAPIPCR